MKYGELKGAVTTWVVLIITLSMRRLNEVKKKKEEVDPGEVQTISHGQHQLEAEP